MRLSRLLAALGILCVLSGHALGQQAEVVNDCDAIPTLPIGQPWRLYQGKDGKACTRISGGSGAVTVAPVGVTATMAAGTIGTNNVFQKVFDANPSRKGCTIQNTTSPAHILYVYAGTTANATTLNSIQISSSAPFYCGQAGSVITNEIAVATSTAGDTFVSSTSQ